MTRTDGKDGRGHTVEFLKSIGYTVTPGAVSNTNAVFRDAKSGELRAAPR